MNFGKVEVKYLLTEYQHFALVSQHHGKNLEEYLHQNRLSAPKLAEKMGVSKVTIYNWIDRAELDRVQLDKLMKHGIDLLSFIKAKEELDIKNRGDEAKPLFPPPKNNIVYVPLYAYGGFLSGYANKVFMDSLERYSYPGIIGEHYMFEVQGDSMKGFVSAGDRVIARPEERLDWMVKNRVYVLQTIDGILIKFFDHIKADYALFKSANKDYPDVRIPLKSLKKVYQVVRVDKDPYKVDLETLIKKLS